MSRRSYSLHSSQLQVSTMKSQLKVYFSLLTAITVILVVLLTIRPLVTFSNGNGSDAKEIRASADNTDDSSLGASVVTATDTATQVSSDNTDDSSVGASVVTATDTTTQVSSDNTEDSSVGDTATDPTATQVRPQTTLQSLEDKGSYSGYVLAYNYYDQQTAALKNLLSFQCWAAQLNMPVVEPFVVTSMFHTPLKTDVSDLLRFSDFYDMGQWNEGYVKPNSFLPFASWEDFVQNSPRDVILVQTLDSGSTCSFPKLKQWYSSFFKRYSFRIVKEVCIPLKQRKPMTTEEFNHLVLNKYRNVTVIFEWWRGICLRKGCKGHTITNIIDTKCDRWRVLGPGTVLQLNASKKVAQYADLYVDRYLKNSSYISVMLRLEYPILTAKKTSIVSKCTKGAQDTWKRLKNGNQLNVTFLAWDVGRFGSATFEKNKYVWKSYKITQNAQLLFTAIYGHSTSVEEWENTFVDVSGSTNPGYIALLQMNIAVRARCIVLIGGGSFHRHALNMYKDLHPETQTQCIVNMNSYCDMT